MSDPDPGGDRFLASVEDEQDRPVDAGRLRAVAEHALLCCHVPPGASLTLTLVGPGRIADLKREHLGTHAATDVLSFPIDDPFAPAPGPVVLGDVVVCPAVAERQARALGRAAADEVAHLVVHGILHILGRSHDDPAAERAMAWEERRILGSFAEERAS